MLLRDLPTPCALVDLDRVEANCARMAARAGDLGVALRPHVKTHKCVEAARRQGGAGLTVSTLAEARAMIDAGFRDLTWAVPVPIPRLPDVAELLPKVDRFSILVDHPATLAEVERLGASLQRRISVFLKVDCGYHRAGVDPTVPSSAALAARMDRAAWIDFRGLLTHAGQSYAARTRADLVRIAEQERDVLVGFAARLRADGIRVPCLSVGSTPTISVVPHLRGIDEIRPGNYVFYDAFQAGLGSCTVDDIAFSVGVTTTGSYPDRGAMVIDAGAIALSKDPGLGNGFGILTDVEGVPQPDLHLHALSQEHGHVRGCRPVGTRLRVLPNHSCLSAAAFGTFHVHRAAEVVATWPPARAW